MAYINFDLLAKCLLLLENYVTFVFLLLLPPLFGWSYYQDSKLRKGNLGFTSLIVQYLHQLFEKSLDYLNLHHNLSQYRLMNILLHAYASTKNSYPYSLLCFIWNFSSVGQKNASQHLVYFLLHLPINCFSSKFCFLFFVGKNRESNTWLIGVLTDTHIS